MVITTDFIEALGISYTQHVHTLNLLPLPLRSGSTTGRGCY